MSTCSTVAVLSSTSTALTCRPLPSCLLIGPAHLSIIPAAGDMRRSTW
jgi:hypothetical protein